MPITFSYSMRGVSSSKERMTNSCASVGATRSSSNVSSFSTRSKRRSETTMLGGPCGRDWYATREDLEALDQKRRRVRLQNRRQPLEPSGEHQHTDKDEQHAGNTIHQSEILLELLEKSEEVLEGERT